MFKKLAKFVIPIFSLILLFTSIKVEAASFKDNQTVDKYKDWTIKFNQEILFDESTKEGIKVVDSKGNYIATSLVLGQDKKSIIVKSPTNGYLEGESYTLIIDTNVKSIYGQRLKERVLFRFNIKDKEDDRYKDRGGYGHNKASYSIDNVMFFINDEDVENAKAGFEVYVDHLLSSGHWKEYDDVYMGETVIMYNGYYDDNGNYMAAPKGGFYPEPGVVTEKYKVSGNHLIAEKILFNRMLTEEEENIIMNYLKQKYNKK